MLDLTDIPIIDNHAHNILKPEFASEYSYGSSFTEAKDEIMLASHSPSSLCYRRSLRNISELLGCENQESAILKVRKELGLENLTKLCIDRGNIETIILDDGFLPEKILPVSWHEQFASIHRVIRLEMLAENLFTQTDHFDDFIEQFRTHLLSTPKNVVGFKSISAYRSGLAIELVSERGAKSCFRLLKELSRNQPFRLNNRALIDFILLQALDVASQKQMPIQFHTGFGDRDLDLSLANPLHLRLILEDDRFENAPIVLLHAGYPYSKEAGYLASVYPQVYVDFGLAVPFLSVAGMKDTVSNLLHLSPTSKILYSSDAHLIPELYYLGSLWGRKILTQVLETSINDGDLTPVEAEEVALQILRENSQKLYQISN